MHPVYWGHNLPQRSCTKWKSLVYKGSFSEHQVVRLPDNCVLHSDELLQTTIAEIHYEPVLRSDEIHL